jgi:5-methylcytosine-specific restriction endonuclease McrA
MKLCWDNLWDLRYNRKTGKWYNDNNVAYRYVEACKNCGEPFLTSNKKDGKYCCHCCASNGDNNPFYNKTHSDTFKQKLSILASKRVMNEDTKKRISLSLKGRMISDATREKLKGRVVSEDTRKRIGDARRGKRHTEETRNLMSKLKYNGGYHLRNLALYDTYAEQLSWCENVRRNQADINIMEVQCTYCGKWYIPKLDDITHRIQALKGQLGGENRLYCSEHCKSACPLYHKSPETLMREDAVRAGRLTWLKMSREVQSELREMVLERDNHTCKNCGATESLHCHHILPVAVEPLLSADIDNCITLCEQCHKQVHQQNGCRTGQLRTEVC